MDPLSILSTVLSTTIALRRWVIDLKSKDNTILDLKSSLSSITLVLHPLREKAASGALDSQVGILACLQDLCECLNTAREHLQTWQDSAAEARKAGAIKRRILAFLEPSPSHRRSSGWSKRIWDEQCLGGVTPSSFSRFVGSQSVAQAVSQYINPVQLPTASSVDRLIVWVAENPENCGASIEYAESLGIKVISFSSLAAVKSWMELNHQFILSVATSHRLRFVSDSARNEGGIFNPAAGELLLRYIRGHLLPSPCLIFAPSIGTTAYVNSYERAGSTSDVQILQGYIKALAEGVRDVEWPKVKGTVQAFNGIQPSPQDQRFIQPLLIYIAGTRAEQDQVHIDYAAFLGITVVSLFSTDELKRYIKSNQAQLRRLGAAHRLRFITQNVRRDSGVLEANAGEDTVEHIRAHWGFAAPVLVLCTSSIATTRFVALYKRVGSTTDVQVVQGYIEALAAGVRDTEWVGFDRKSWSVMHEDRQ
ncbi:hypothetical protein GGX14DRAFT_626744 [Mycena pura]|uniref:Uncharacterized protein n=1 Tax=Mycena pura TaxID=153505 RepID=A0AAD6YQJ7_9AGAR|nr:hypothetical protein GGX14DRAFT_626744 [Mycena pura]